jgi:hypothetical protein
MNTSNTTTTTLKKNTQLKNSPRASYAAASLCYMISIIKSLKARRSPSNPWEVFPPEIKLEKTTHLDTNRMLPILAKEEGKIQPPYRIL